MPDAVAAVVMFTIATIPSDRVFVFKPVNRHVDAARLPPQVTDLPAAVAAGPAVTVKAAIPADGARVHSRPASEALADPERERTRETLPPALVEADPKLSEVVCAAAEPAMKPGLRAEARNAEILAKRGQIEGSQGAMYRMVPAGRTVPCKICQPQCLLRTTANRVMKWAAGGTGVIP